MRRAGWSDGRSRLELAVRMVLVHVIPVSSHRSHKNGGSWKEKAA